MCARRFGCEYRKGIKGRSEMQQDDNKENR